MHGRTELTISNAELLRLTMLRLLERHGYARIRYQEHRKSGVSLEQFSLWDEKQQKEPK